MKRNHACRERNWQCILLTNECTKWQVECTFRKLENKKVYSHQYFRKYLCFDRVAKQFTERQKLKTLNNEHFSKPCSCQAWKSRNLPSFLGIKSYISLAENKLSLQATSRSNRRDKDDPQHSMKIDSRPFCRRNIIFGQTTIGDENDTWDSN